MRWIDHIAQYVAVVLDENCALLLDGIKVLGTNTPVALPASASTAPPTASTAQSDWLNPA